MLGALARMAEAAGAPPTRLMREFAGFSFGPGRVSFADYEHLRLYDEAFWAGADRRAVVGARRGRELALLANFRHDWFGLAANRLAWGAYLSAHGLPTVPTLAVFCRDLATPSRRLLRTREELRAFLTERAGRALVGRPAEGGHATAIVGQAASAIEHLIEDVVDNHAGGYLFQPLIAPHPQIATLTGGRLAAVRLITVNADFGPRVVRALLKLPGSSTPIQLDLRSGQALRLSVRSPVAGARIPDWEALKAAAVEAARLMRHLPLLGWDVAPAEGGPVILGLIPTPDFVPHQLADRRGMLDEEFLGFLDQQRHAAHAYAEEARAAWG
jgi:hypothetical protein